MPSIPGFVVQLPGIQDFIYLFWDVRSKLSPLPSDLRSPLVCVVGFLFSMMNVHCGAFLCSCLQCWPSSCFSSVLSMNCALGCTVMMLRIKVYLVTIVQYGENFKCICHNSSSSGWFTCITDHYRVYSSLASSNHHFSLSDSRATAACYSMCAFCIMLEPSLLHWLLP